MRRIEFTPGLVRAEIVVLVGEEFCKSCDNKIVVELGCMAMIKAVLTAEKRPDCNILLVRFHANLKLFRSLQR